MSNISTLLRQLAAEIDKVECENATQIENMKKKYTIDLIRLTL